MRPEARLRGTSFFFPVVFFLIPFSEAPAACGTGPQFLGLNQRLLLWSHFFPPVLQSLS